MADWTGFRPDSAPPIAAGEEIIKWWKQKGRDPREKLLVFSDGMDVGSIEEAYHHFAGRVRVSFGWGTNLTNDFVGCAPDGIRRSRSDLDRLQGDVGRRPASRQAFGQSGKGHRRASRRSNVICAYSAMPAAFARRFWSEK